MTTHSTAAGERALSAALDTAAAVLTAPARRATALAYLRQRGIPADQVPEQWPLGHAPAGWTRLTDTLLAAGFSPDVLLGAGLARRSSRGNVIDTFRDRVLFPVHDHHGRLCGFIGRDLSGAPGAPKYLNTAQGALFDKSTLLYGYREHRQAAGRASVPVLVEGPLDVLAITAHASADPSCSLVPVAACGTAVTGYHIAMLADMSEQGERPVVIAMDSDAAGRAAALAAGQRLRRAGLDVRIAALPNGTDPADYLAASGTIDAFTPDHALPLLTVQVQHAIDTQGDRMQWIEGRLAAARRIATLLADHPAAHVAAQIGWISHALQITPSSLLTVLAAAQHAADRPSSDVHQSPSAFALAVD